MWLAGPGGGVAEVRTSACRYWQVDVAQLAEGAPPKPTLGSPTPYWAKSLGQPVTPQKQQTELAPLKTPHTVFACCIDRPDTRNQCRF